jgi:amino acid transporter
MIRIGNVLDALLGKPLASYEEEENKVDVLQGIPMLGLDALGSSAYGPEAALTVLLPLGAAGLHFIEPLLGVVLAILLILYLSYRQTIAAYPNGGGSYTVAKENLGVRMGLLAAAALLLDYILNVAVGISAGVGALVSAFPALNGHVLALCLAILLLVALVNLRGIRESGAAWAIPTYLFVASLAGVLLLGLFKALGTGGLPPQPVVPPPLLPAATQSASVWLLMRAFASGCTAMTGVEAVSNGVTAFAEPGVKRARHTLTAIVVILGLLLGGIGFLARAYHVGATLPGSSGYQSIISQLTAAIAGRGALYYVTLSSVLAVLCLSANTSFAGFPRLCRLIAEDDFLPHGFANKGRRLVYSLGIVILTVLAGGLLILFGGITDRLIPLFAVGAFLAFTLSQAGMVVHWSRAMRRGEKRSKAALAINAVGAAATGGALAVVLVAKFVDGAWITVLLVPAMLYVFYRVKDHYVHIETETRLSRRLNLNGIEPPMVVIPISGWNTITEKALRFAYALSLSPDMQLVHISTGEVDAERLRREWHDFIEPPIRDAGLPMPRLVILSSPYRRLVTPLLAYVMRLKRENPDQQIAVLIPELVEPRWYQYLLHNQAATVLKAALLFQGDRRVVVINVPWYLRDEQGARDAAPGTAAEASDSTMTTRRLVVHPGPEQERRAS